MQSSARDTHFVPRVAVHSGPWSLQGSSIMHFSLLWQQTLLKGAGQQEDPLFGFFDKVNALKAALHSSKDEKLKAKSKISIVIKVMSAFLITIK